MAAGWRASRVSHAIRVHGGLVVAGLVLAFALSSAAEGPKVHSSPAGMAVCRVLPGGLVAAGGPGGLVLHDGRKARTLTALDGLPGTSVGALLPDETGAGEIAALWVGLELGLARVAWDGSRVRVTKRTLGPDVRALAEHEGRLFVGTWGRGVARVEAEGLSHPFGAAPSRVAALASWGGEILAASAGEGLWRLSAAKAQAVPGGPEGPFLWSALVTDGRLLVGGTSGLWSNDGQTILHPDVRALVHDGRRLLVGTFGEGLLALSGPAGAPEGVRLAGLPSSVVTGLDARDGSVCAATAEGLFVGRGAGEGPEAPGWQRLSWSGPPSNDISALSWAAGGLVVGTFQSGAALFEGGRWKTLDLPVDAARVNVVLVEPLAGGRRIWLGTARGLFALEGGVVRRIGVAEGLPHAEVHAVLRLAQGDLVVGTARGLARVDAKGAVHAVAERGGPETAAVWALAEQVDGRLLVGTTRGLFHKVPGGPWRRACLASGELADDWVTAILVTPEHVFVGSYAKGVSRLVLRRGKVLRSEGLGGRNVNPGGLARVGSSICAATMQGLLCRCPSGAAEWKPMEGAAPGVDVTGVLRGGGRIFVSSRRGLGEWPDGGLSLPSCTPSVSRF